MPLNAHCDEPSSRLTIEKSPVASAAFATANGGHAVAHPPLQLLLPAASLSKMYSVLPSLLASKPSLVCVGLAWTARVTTAIAANIIVCFIRFPLRLVALVEHLSQIRKGRQTGCSSRRIFLPKLDAGSDQSEFARGRTRPRGPIFKRHRQPCHIGKQFLRCGTHLKRRAAGRLGWDGYANRKSGTVFWQR